MQTYSNIIFECLFEFCILFSMWLSEAVSWMRAPDGCPSKVLFNKRTIGCGTIKAPPCLKVYARSTCLLWRIYLSKIFKKRNYWRKKSKLNKKIMFYFSGMLWYITSYIVWINCFCVFNSTNICSALNQVSNVFSVAGPHTSPVLVGAKVPTFCLICVISSARTF